MTFDEYKKLDEFEREQFLRQNGIVVSIKIDNCRHSYALIDTPDKSYVASDRSGLLEYLELIYLLKYTDKQKLFEKETHEFLEKFKYEIITKHTLYHIKYGLQHILRSYENNCFIKVKSYKNKVIISQSIDDFDVEFN